MRSLPSQAFHTSDTDFTKTVVVNFSPDPNFPLTLFSILNWKERMIRSSPRLPTSLPQTEGNIMCQSKVSASFKPLSLLTFLIALIHWAPVLYAQASAPVSVRMLDAIDSSKDPAGKQYRASVTKEADGGNGVIIPRGAAAAVTLVNSGSGWTTQLVSVTINGQPVTVASGSASVTSAAQSAAGAAISSMNSVLGGFGRRVSAPSAVAAVATGQRVVLPLGTTLNFVLAGSPSTAAQPPSIQHPPPVQQTASAPASKPAVANPAPPPPAAANASGPGTWYRCNARGSTASRMVVYATPYIHTTASVTTLEQAWTRYVRLTYPMDKLVAEAEQCEQFGDSADQRSFAMDYEDKGWTGPNYDLTHVNWTYTPAEIADTNAKLAAKAASTPAPAPAPHVCRPGDRNPVCRH